MSVRTVLRVAMAVGLLMLVTGCRVGIGVGPTNDTLDAWSEQPLPADPALAAIAAAEHSACNPGAPGGAQIRVLIQDRRMPNTAAFLVSGPGTFGGCFVMRSGNTTGGSGPAPGAMSGPLAIDDNGFGTIAEMDIRQLGGRVAGQASRVVIELADGRSVTASVGGGYWLAWWPDTAAAERVIATDAAGTTVADVGVPQ